MRNQAVMQRRSLSSLIGGIILGLFVAGIGMIFVIALFNGWRRAEETRRWPTTGATITRSELEEYNPTPSSPVRYRPIVEYAYAFGEEGFQSDRVRRVNKTSSHRHKAQKVVDRYPLGQETKAWVNPADPKVSVLEHDTRAVLYTIWFPGIFVVAGIGILVTALKQYRGGA